MPIVVSNLPFFSSVTVAMEIFNEHMPQPNQLSFVPDCSVSAQDLLRTPDTGDIT